jgi:hypothetical protein
MWAAENFSKSDTLQQNTQMQLRICATHWYLPLPGVTDF